MLCAFRVRQQTAASLDSLTIGRNFVGVKYFVNYFYNSQYVSLTYIMLYVFSTPAAIQLIYTFSFFKKFQVTQPLSSLIQACQAASFFQDYDTFYVQQSS